MYDRDTPHPTPPERWPYLVCEVGSRPWWFRAPSITDAVRLQQWLADIDTERARTAAESEQVKAALVEAANAEAIDEPAVLDLTRKSWDLAAKAVHLTAAPAGFLCVRCWADPVTGLHARDTYDAAGFAGQGDARLAAGEAAWEELAAVWSDAEIMAVAGVLSQALGRASAAINWREASVKADFFGHTRA